MMMNLELIFSIASILAMLSWLMLLASPFIPQFADKTAGTIIPVALSVGYLSLILFNSSEGGGFDSLSSVMELFTYEQAVLAGWIHFLAFDLFIGAWVCRTARTENIRFWIVVPCLFLTFLFGPVGFLTFQLTRSAKHLRSEVL